MRHIWHRLTDLSAIGAVRDQLAYPATAKLLAAMTSFVFYPAPPLGQ